MRRIRAILTINLSFVCVYSLSAVGIKGSFLRFCGMEWAWVMKLGAKGLHLVCKDTECKIPYGIAVLTSLAMAYSTGNIFRLCYGYS